MTTPAAAIVGNDKDVSHNIPVDSHSRHVWLIEPPAASGVLTQDGMTQIARHKYKSGTYTALDNLLNPMWTNLTELLPLWLAPNAVTTIGGAFCLSSYLVSAYYNAKFDSMVPNWVIVWNGICMMIYYTLDAMDGKQARRTNSSSPLGQLFDHGMDCVCNINHLSMVQCIVPMPPTTFFWMQSALQFAFFEAQWEEYYTGTLPHATGNIGVTEVNYGMGLWSIASGLIISREAYQIELKSIMPVFLEGISFSLPLQSLITNNKEVLQVSDVLAVGWVYMIMTLSTLSAVRVAQHLKFSVKHTASAYSKLLTPGILCFCALFVCSKESIRFESLSLGLCLCLITIKMIVFGMAHMAYASIQCK